MESKWYYRVARIIFLWAPLILVAVIILLMIISGMSGKTLEEFGAVLQNNISPIVYSLIGLALYLLILKGIWRGFLYIIFGGLEDDIKPKVIAAKPVTGQVNQPIIPQDSSVAVVNYLKEAKSKEATASAVMGLIILVIMYFAFKPSSSSTSGGGSVKTKTNTNTSTCTPTGCGTSWRCSGTYYSSSGAQKSISGCYADKTSVTSLNSWSGTCLKCPY